MGRLDPHKLVFIDETWIKTNMAPIRGWGRKGKLIGDISPAACSNYLANAGYASV